MQLNPTKTQKHNNYLGPNFPSQHSQSVLATGDSEGFPLWRPWIPVRIGFWIVIYCHPGINKLPICDLG